VDQQQKNFTVYRSSAGSGKTYTLVKEYLRLALSANTEAYRHILAVTFTNKAAAEMKSRILHALVQFTSMVKVEKTEMLLFEALKEELKVSGAILQGRSKAVLSEIVHHYADFGVSTIDKFTHKIVRTFAHDLKLSMGFEVEMDEAELLRRAIEKLVAMAGREEELTKLLLDFTQTKVDNDRNWQVEQDLFDFSQILMKEDPLGFVTRLLQWETSDFIAVRKQLRTEMKSFKEGLMATGEKALKVLGNNGVDPSQLAGGSRGIGNYFVQLGLGNTDKMEPSATIQKYVNEGKWCAGKLDASMVSTIIGIQDELAGLFHSAKTQVDDHASRFHLFTLIERNLFPLALLSRVKKALHAEKEERNVVGISDFNKTIAEVVNKEPIPFIYERIGERYRHFLIDEFQDTSILQWNNLLPLIENALSNAHYNMIVGDAKQSIYRWRGGEVEQFVQLPALHRPLNPEFALHREQSLQANFEEKALKNNYRSKAEVVQFNNAFFESITALLPETGKVIYKNVNQQFKSEHTGGAVVVEPIATDVYEEHIGVKVLESITQCVDDGYEFRDITILCRRKTDGYAMANLLIEAGIPVVSAESLLLTASTKIQLVLHLLQLLNDPFSAFHVVKVMEYLVLTGKIDGDHYNLIQQTAVGKDNCFQLLDQLGFSIDQRALLFMTIYEATETIMRCFGLFEQTDPYVLSFLDVVYRFGDKEGNELKQFFSWWEAKKHTFSIQLPEGTNAVQVMTIHKSKGLEFPVVIHPYATYDARIQRQNEWVTVNDHALLPLNQFLVPLNKTLTLTELAAVYEEEMEKSLIDTYNLMYVTFTRPTDRLYIFPNPPSKSRANRSVSDLLAAYYETTTAFAVQPERMIFGNLEARREVDERSEEKSFVLEPPISNDWREQLEISYRSPLLWEQGRNAIHFGNLIHDVLAKVITVADVAKQAGRLVKSGLINEEEAAQLIQRITKLLSDQRIHHLFREGLMVLNELNILSKDTHNQRPDRVVLFDNEAAIIDYKTGAVESKHSKQLQRYADVLKEMGYQVKEMYLIYLGEEEQIIQVA
jgi:ATP-dependent exoDNAse (exonuclease V) beta subunit